MPVTPLHFGPSGVLGFAFRNHLDWPVFVLANVVVDLEVLAVILFFPNAIQHGIIHSFLIGGAVGALFGGLGYLFRRQTVTVMKFVRLSYQTNLKTAVWSGILGVWFHVLIDSFIYHDIKPFFPIISNPMYGYISQSTVYLASLGLCAVLLGWYYWKADHYRGQ